MNDSKKEIGFYILIQIIKTSRYFLTCTTFTFLPYKVESDTLDNHSSLFFTCNSNSVYILL